MTRPDPALRELTLPVGSMAALRRSLVAEVGPDAAARALRASGFAAGDTLFDLLSRAGYGSEAAAETAETAFWRRLSEFFTARGWGRLDHTQPHQGLGALDAPDWVEADPGAMEARPSCFFTTGMLANLLGHTAGRELAVLEVECRSRGDLQCRFLFGAPETVGAVFDRITSGVAADAAIAALG